MTEQLVQFGWVRGTTFEFTDTLKRAEERWLVPTLRLADPDKHPWAHVKDVERQPYDPLTDEPALFRTFADLEPNPMAIANFANRYGPLGITALLPSGPMTSPSGRSFSRDDRGEPLDCWKTEIALLSSALEIWDALCSDKSRLLSRRIDLKFRDGELEVARFLGTAVEGAPLHERRVREGGDPESLSRDSNIIVSKDVERQFWIAVKDLKPRGALLHDLGWFLTQVAVNYRLRRFTSLQLAYVGRRELSIYAMPNCLVGAMWIQFARAVADPRTDHRRCPVCKEWFELSPRAKRRQSQYCSVRCRVQHYRDKQVKAVRLVQKGEDIRVVAKKLDTNVKTLRGWLKKADATPRRKTRRRTR